MEPIDALRKEVLPNTPHFRRELDRLDDEVEDVGQTMALLAGAVEKYRATSQANHDATITLSSALLAASDQFRLPEDCGVEDKFPLAQFGIALEKLASYHHVLVTQIEFLKRLMDEKVAEFEAAKEERETLGNATTKMWQTMSKFCACQNEGLATNWDQLSRRGEKAFSARQLVQQISSDHLEQIRELQSTSRNDVLMKFTDQLTALTCYFSYGQQLFSKLEPYNKQLFEVTAAVQDQAAEAKALSEARRARLEVKIERDHEETLQVLQSIIPPGASDKERGSKTWKQRAIDIKRNLAHQVIRRSPKNKRKQMRPTMQSPTGGPEEEEEAIADPVNYSGYMFRRHRDKKWKLDFFCIEDNHLVTVNEDGMKTRVANLLLSSVRPCLMEQAPVRFFCFELISPNSSVMLQALGEKEYQSWMDALQAGIAGALESGNADCKDHEVKEQPAFVLASVPGNKNCVDCGAPDPGWASINLGVLMCLQCSGSHRGLGVSYSKVKSVSLDRWAPDTLEFMKSVGNAKSNACFEARLSDFPSIKRPTSDTQKPERDAFARLKYIDRKFANEAVAPAQNMQTATTTATPGRPGRPQPPTRTPVKQPSLRPTTDTLPMPAVSDGSSDEEAEADFSAGLSPRVRESLRIKAPRAMPRSGLGRRQEGAAAATGASAAGTSASAARHPNDQSIGAFMQDEADDANPASRPRPRPRPRVSTHTFNPMDGDTGEEEI